MSTVLTIRDYIRDFIRKYEEIITPVFRFFLSFIVFTYINKMFGYNELFTREIVVILLSIISALVPTSIIVLLGGVVVVVSAMSVSANVGALVLIMFILMYCTYLRMFPDCGWILAFVPIMYMLKLYFAIPLVIVIFSGPAGAVPAGFGVIIYYVSGYIRDIKDGNMLEDKDFQAYSYVLDHIVKDKEVLSMIIIFAVVIVITFVLYKLPYDYAWYVAIGVGGLLNILVALIVDGAVGSDLSMGKVVSGTFVGIILALIIRAGKGLVDYAHKEVVQFEDDDYYYYVKAIPKYNSKKKTEAAKKQAQSKQTQPKQTQPKQPQQPQDKNMNPAEKEVKKKAPIKLPPNNAKNAKNQPVDKAQQMIQQQMQAQQMQAQQMQAQQMQTQQMYQQQMYQQQVQAQQMAGQNPNNPNA